jgi:hypothetical protein
VLIRAPVQLGRASRARAGAAGAALVGHVEQGLVYQPVEMKRRGRARQLKRGGSVVATDRFGLARHVVVEPAAGRLVECGDRRDLVLPGSIYNQLLLT